MKIKRMAALVLGLCMVAGILGGCKEEGEKNGEKEGSNANNATGKYVEENVELPLSQEETLFTLLKNAKGELEVYSNDGEAYFKYVSTDGKEWTKEEANWITAISEGEAVSITAGADGNDYAIVKGEENMRLLKQTGAETAEEIVLPELNEANDAEETQYYSFGTELYVMENGTIVLAGLEAVNVYDPSDGKILHSFPYTKSSSDADNPISITGENMAIPSKDNKGFTVWNVEQEKEETAMSYGSDVRDGKIILEENNEIYFLNTEGIHHMNPDGTLVETLVDGGNLTMGTPGVYVEDFVKGDGEDFYAFFIGNQNGIKHYYYDENAKTVSEQKLSIYSLKENATVRQAVSVFQQKHPEVEVSYKTGESDSSTTTADKIRVLNTELLNKSGADVLVLDDLPVDSFIEKGVLKDISDVINPLIEDGTLQKNIAECYLQEDGKIYGMPVKYGIPILFGNQEMIDAMESLDTLENWLDTHEGQEILTNSSFRELTAFLVNMYYDEIFDEEGMVKEDKLKQCISCVKRIGELYDAEIEKNYINDETGESLEDMEGVYFSDWNAGSDMEVIEKGQVASSEMKGLTDMMAPFTIMRENDFPLRFHKNSFVPHGVVGINNTTENTELAEEFLKVLFSDEVQGYDLMDGFPVNKNAAALLQEQGLDQPIDSQEGTGTSDTGSSLMIGVGGSEDGSSYTFGYPLKTEVEELLEKAGELNHPAQADSVLQDMIMEEAKAYYEGSKELDATVLGIKAKVDTYRSE